MRVEIYKLEDGNIVEDLIRDDGTSFRLISKIGINTSCMFLKPGRPSQVCMFNCSPRLQFEVH